MPASQRNIKNLPIGGAWLASGRGPVAAGDSAAPAVRSELSTSARGTGADSARVANDRSTGAVQAGASRFAKGTAAAQTSVAASTQ